MHCITLATVSYKLERLIEQDDERLIDIEASVVHIKFLLFMGS